MKPCRIPLRLSVRLSTQLSVLLCGLLLFGAAAAQDWPQRPVRVIVPFPAGGNTDQIARITAERLSNAFSQQFIVENRVGAGGAIAAELVAKSPPDGYTLLVGAAPMIAILPYVQKVAYDPVKDFAPVSNIGANPFVLGVHVSVPARSVKEFVDYASARAGQLNYASGGNGTVGHLSGALFASRAGLVMTHVPYKGGAPAVADLVAGQVQMYFGNASELIQHGKSGKIRLLGVSSVQRAPQLPEVPAIAESYPGFRTLTWNGLLAPVATPQAIIGRLSAEVQKVVRDPVVAARLQQIGVDPLGSTQAEFAETIRTDSVIWQEAIKAAGMQRE
ncbi:MAG: tripartite tricarboxylate transporter substrate binding protein [Betaproteobacteria bacterium]|nr:tripartite tricarboxylate transporter substrate binding protein [Betaproteobacteria bacterium]